jgi:hypothetical protein
MRKISSLILGLILCISAVNAQQLMFGFGNTFMHQKGNIISVKTAAGSNSYHTLDTINKTMFGANLYLNYALPIYKLNFYNSLNLMLGVNGLFSFSNKYKEYDQFARAYNYGTASSLVMGAQIPVYFCYNKGTHATVESTKKNGYMIGWGMVYTMYQSPTDKSAFLAPAVLFEWRFAESLAARFEYNAKRDVSEYATYTGFVPRLATRFCTLSLSYNMRAGAPYFSPKPDRRIIKTKKTNGGAAKK